MIIFYIYVEYTRNILGISAILDCTTSQFAVIGDFNAAFNTNLRLNCHV